MPFEFKGKLEKGNGKSISPKKVRFPLDKDRASQVSAYAGTETPEGICDPHQTLIWSFLIKHLYTSRKRSDSLFSLPIPVFKILFYKIQANIRVESSLK